jgi:restriction endonuclease S subunit
MSNIDSELTLLRQKIELLEKQKRAEEELKAMKEANPLATIGQIIEESKEEITKYIYSNPSLKFHYEEKVAMMEPIFNMLKNIQQRLEVLEQGRS